MNKRWTDEELQRALTLHRTLKSWTEVGNMLGRSRSATHAAVKRWLGTAPPSPDTFSNEAIGKTKECEKLRQDAKLGSQILREACLDLFCRTANRYSINLSDAMACHLGYYAKPIIPGCERAIRGQFAQRRLAA